MNWSLSLELLQVFIFLILALIHVYWMFGGKWALDASFPKIESKPERRPGKLAYLPVALVLLFFSSHYLFKTGLLSLHFPEALGTNLDWIIPSLFLLRSIGDFNYLGLFKKKRADKFSFWDSKLYVPLCLIIAVGGYLSSYIL